MFLLFISFCILQNIVAQHAVVRFDEIDSDNDRHITFNELKKWHRTNHIIRSDNELKEMIRSRDRNNDGMLNIAEFVTLLLTRNRINRNKELFEQVDINDDGVITRAEAMKSRKNGNNEKIIHEIFQLIDINNDNKITFDELTSVMDDNSGTQQHSGTQVRRRQNLAHQLITLIDQNFDQRLSLQEVQNFADANRRENRIGILREFEYIDSNRDGFLTINEIIKEPEKIAALVHFQEPPPVINN